MAHHYDTLDKTTFCIMMKKTEEMRGDRYCTLYPVISEILKTGKKMKTHKAISHERPCTEEILPWLRCKVNS